MKTVRLLDRLLFKPGEFVPVSGLYCVEHPVHKLMHTATLVNQSRFPRCKRCGTAVRFSLVRRVKDGLVFPFRSTAILEEYPERADHWRKAS